MSGSNNCLCNGSKRGRHLPMVFCERCRNWFHFECVGLTEEQVLPPLWFCSACDRARLMANIQGDVLEIVDGDSRNTLLELRILQQNLHETTIKLTDLASEVKDLKEKGNERLEVVHEASGRAASQGDTSIDLHQEREECEMRIKELEEIILQKDKALANLQQENDSKAKELNNILLERDEAIQNASNLKSQYGSKVKELEEIILQKGKALANLQQENDSKAKELNNILLERDEAIQNASNLKSQYDSKVKEFEAVLLEREEAVKTIGVLKCQYEEYKKNNVKRSRLSLGHRNASASQPV